MRVKRLTEEQINYNILNGLNLYNEELGEEYLAGGFNPLGENFILTEAYILERLASKMELSKEIVSPEFVEAGIKQTRLAFLNSIANCKILLEKIEEMLNDPNIPEYEKEKLRKLKLYLICRIQLLTKYTKTIKKDKNTLKMYENVELLNSKISKQLECTYSPTEQFTAKDFIKMVKDSMSAIDSLAQIVESQAKGLENKVKTILKEGLEPVKEVIKEGTEVAKQATKQVEKVITKPIEAIKDIIIEPEPSKEEYVSTTKVSVRKTIIAKEPKKENKTKKQPNKQNDGLSR